MQAGPGGGAKGLCKQASGVESKQDDGLLYTLRFRDG